MLDQELRDRLQTLAAAGQADPTPAVIAKIRQRRRRKVQRGAATALASLIVLVVAFGGVRRLPEATPVVPAAPPAAVAPRTFVAQLSTGTGGETAIVDARSGAIVRRVPGTQRPRTGSAVIVSPDVRSMYVGKGPDPAHRCEFTWTRVDLTTGATRTVSVGAPWNGDLSLSHDGRWAAFLQAQSDPRPLPVGRGRSIVECRPSTFPKELVVRDLATGSQRGWTIPAGTVVDEVQLSPDATRLALLLRRKPARGLLPLAVVHVLPLAGTTSITQGRDLPIPLQQTSCSHATFGPTMLRFAGNSDRLLTMEQWQCGNANAPVHDRLAVYDLGTGRMISSTLIAEGILIDHLSVDATGQHVIAVQLEGPNPRLPMGVYVLRDGHPEHVPFNSPTEQIGQADW